MFSMEVLQFSPVYACAYLDNMIVGQCNYWMLQKSYYTPVTRGHARTAISEKYANFDDRSAIV